MKLVDVALILLTIFGSNVIGSALKKKLTRSINDKPNIFFIMVDDWGSYDIDLCAQTKDISTPNMNRLAREGVFLNNYYATPLCTPSRASLMTGVHVHRTGLQHYIIVNNQPMALPLDFTIMPEHLNNLGYTSRMIGKWHLGFYHKEFTPTYRGFKSHYGSWNGNIDHFTHRSILSLFPKDLANFTTNSFYEKDLTSPGRILIDGYDFRRDMEVEINDKMKFLADVYCQELMNVLHSHDQSQPLFMYMAHHSVHRGNHLEEMKAPYNYTRYFPYIKDRERRNMAGSLLAVDICLGKMIKALDETDMLQNSIIIVSSDNGAPVSTQMHSNGGSNYPYNGYKGSVFEGGVKANSFIWSPLIEKPRNVWNGLMHVTDWLPTLYRIAGGDVSDLGPDIDGMDMWSALSTGINSPREEILLHHDSISEYAGIRWKNYKLVTGYEVQVKFDFVGNRSQPASKFTSSKKDYCWPAETRLTDQIMDKFYRNHPETNFNISSTQYCEALAKSTPPVWIDPKMGCLESDTYCLFDLDQDPYETKNIAKEKPKIVEYLVERLKFYDSQALTALNVPLDYNAHPYFHEDQWVPYRDPEYTFFPTANQNMACDD